MKRAVRYERLWFGSGEWIRTTDLRVMSPTSYHCSTPRRRAKYSCFWCCNGVFVLLRSSEAMMRVVRVATEWPWHRPVFPGLGDPSIVGAGAFHYRVRHGNGWDHSALATRTNRSPREQPRLFQRE